MYNRWPYQRRQAAADNCLVRNLKAISNLDLGQFTPILDLPVADLAEAMYTTGSSIKQGILRAKDVQAMEAAATVALQKVGKTLALLHCRCDSSTYSVRQAPTWLYSVSFQKDIQLFVDKAEPILRNVSVSNSRKTLPELKHSVAHVEAHCHHVNNTLQQALLNNASTAKHLASHGEAMQHAVAFFVSQHLEMTGVNLEEIVASAAQSAAAQQAAAVQEDEQDDYFYSSAYHGSDYENDMDNGMMAYGAKLAGKGSLRRKKAGGGTPAGKGVRDWNYRRRLDDFENDRLPEYWIDWKAPLHDTPVVSPSEWQTSKVVSSPVPAPVQPCQETVLAPPTDSSAQARVQPQVQPPKEQRYLRRHGKSPVGATGIDLPVVTVVQASSNPAHYPAEESGSDQETECDVDEIDIDDTFDLDRDDFEQVLEDERMECTV